VALPGLQAALHGARRHDHGGLADPAALLVPHVLSRGGIEEGVSALQIQRETGLTYKSAPFLMHRIRWAMAPANENEPKLGQNSETVEFDEI
jgi:hypothetical protein